MEVPYLQVSYKRTLLYSSTKGLISMPLWVNYFWVPCSSTPVLRRGAGVGLLVVGLGFMGGGGRLTAPGTT